MSSAMTRSSLSISSLARASTASRRGSRAPVSRATSGGSVSERSRVFIRRTTSAAALLSVGVSWAAATRRVATSTTAATGSERRIKRTSAYAGGAGKLRDAHATRHPRGRRAGRLGDELLPGTGLVLEARDPAGDVQHLMRPRAGEVLLELVAVAPGVEGVVLVQVAVELEVRGGAPAGVLEPGDLGAGRRFAVGDAPAERTRVQRGAVQQGANFDALRGEEQPLLRNTGNPGLIAALCNLCSCTGVSTPRHRRYRGAAAGILVRTLDRSATRHDHRAGGKSVGTGRSGPRGAAASAPQAPGRARGGQPDRSVLPRSRRWDVRVLDRPRALGGRGRSSDRSGALRSAAGGRTRRRVGPPDPGRGRADCRHPHETLSVGAAGRATRPSSPLSTGSAPPTRRRIPPDTGGTPSCRAVPRAGCVSGTRGRRRTGRPAWAAAWSDRAGRARRTSAAVGRARPRGSAAALRWGNAGRRERLPTA